jgi:membrane protein implicated in regulation of membrane protease activity
MEMLSTFDQWWIWVSAAIIMLTFEVFLPGFVFLGFAIGAGIVGVVLLIFGSGVASVPGLFLIWTLFSLISWYVMRKMVGERGGQVQTFDTDIND